jgi:hypothetical protein
MGDLDLVLGAARQLAEALGPHTGSPGVSRNTNLQQLGWLAVAAAGHLHCHLVHAGLTATAGLVEEAREQLQAGLRELPEEEVAT